MDSNLTKKQREVYECITHYIDEHGYGPTVREIGTMMGLSSTSTVQAHINKLEEKGYILRAKNKSRSITLPLREEDEEAVEGSVGYDNIISVPLVGNVAAGEPILAEENITETIGLPVEIVGDAASFMLSVRGESMIEAGINDGDYVVVKQQPVANNGDIVVALVEDGATVKTFYKESDHIRLQPENSSMEPIILRDCSIAGKVVAVFRRL